MNVMNDNTRPPERTKCEIFSRSMGFIRPIQHFNIGKYAEFEARRMATEQNCLSLAERHQALMRKAA